jgi:hypothetical protein
MKILQVAAISVLSIVALAAIGQAGIASATVLCSTNTSPCTGTKYSVGTKIEASLKAGTEDVLTAAFATVKCASGVMKGSISNAGGAAATVVGPFTTLNASSCNCPSTVLKLGEFEVHYTSAGNGTLTGKNTQITYTCSGISCIFGTAAAGTTLGTISGGSPAVITINAKLVYIAGDPVFHASNFVCTLGSGTGTWTATYQVSTPASLFVSAS